MARPRRRPEGTGNVGEAGAGGCAVSAAARPPRGGASWHSLLPQRAGTASRPKPRAYPWQLGPIQAVAGWAAGLWPPALVAAAAPARSGPRFGLLVGGPSKPSRICGNAWISEACGLLHLGGVAGDARQAHKAGDISSFSPRFCRIFCSKKSGISRGKSGTSRKKSGKNTWFFPRQPAPKRHYSLFLHLES